MSPYKPPEAVNTNANAPRIKKRRKRLNIPVSLKDIERFLKKSRTYLGAIFIDSFKNLLVKVEDYSVIVYCNSHWFCIFVTKHTFEIFDPTGFLQKSKCIGKKFLSFLKVHIKGKILYCNPKIQSDSSQYCGLYVIFFIRMREMGHTFFDILRKFTKKYKKNDTLVKSYVNEMNSV